MNDSFSDFMRSSGHFLDFIRIRYLIIRYLQLFLYLLYIIFFLQLRMGKGKRIATRRIKREMTNSTKSTILNNMKNSPFATSNDELYKFFSIKNSRASCSVRRERFLAFLVMHAKLGFKDVNPATC